MSRRAAAIRVARAEPDRRRVELRNEYIASRARVAAFTGEDSGSAYLAREAAHQRAAQAFSPARGTAVRRRG